MSGHLCNRENVRHELSLNTSLMLFALQLSNEFDFRYHFSEHIFIVCASTCGLETNESIFVYKDLGRDATYAISGYSRFIALFHLIVKYMESVLVFSDEIGHQFYVILFILPGVNE